MESELTAANGGPTLPPTTGAGDGAPSLESAGTVAEESKKFIPTGLSAPVAPDVVWTLFRETVEGALADNVPEQAALEVGIRLLSDMLAAIEQRQCGISVALSEQVRSLAGPLRLPHAWEAEQAALLAQIGAITLPMDLLIQRTAGLTLSHADQFLFRSIPEIGHNILTRFPSMRLVAKIILYQNKNYDGTGFPADAVAGVGIPIGSRLLRILTDAAEMQEGGQALDVCLREMRYRYGRYDPDLMDELIIYLRRTGMLSNKAQAGKPLLLNELQAGQVLTSSVETFGGVMVLAPGNTLTSQLIQRLRRYSRITGIREPIFVQPGAQRPGLGTASLSSR